MPARVVDLDPHLSDAVLVGRARGGDLSAKEALFRRHVGLATGLAVRLLGRDTELEDVVHDAFVAAFGALGGLHDPQAFVAWFSAIVTRTAVAVLRRRRLLARFGFTRSEPADLDRVLAPDAPPDVAADLRALYAAIDRLPVDERVALILRRVEELKLEEIAERTGWSLATAKRRLSSAEALLAKQLGWEGVAS